MKNLFIVAFSVTVIISSCSTGKLTKYYNSITLEKNDDTITKYIEVNAYIISKEKVEAPKPKTIFDLSPQGQAALIREIGKKETGTDTLLATLASTLSLNDISSEDIIDYSQFEQRIIVSIRNKSHMPADRIPAITVTLGIDPKIVKILSCNKLTTEYQTLDLGKANYANSLNAEVSANALGEAGTTDVKTGEKDSSTSSLKTTVGLSGKVSASRSFSEEVLLKQRIVTLNASIDSNKLKLYQEGISGIDITGNILADVTFKFEDLGVEKVYSFSNLKRDSLNNPENVKVNERLIVYPNQIQDVYTKVSFEADFRRVISNHKTISETDDEVILYFGGSKQVPALLMSIDKLLPKLYYLVLKDDSTKMPVEIYNPYVGGSGKLLFNSYNEASAFVFWLKSKFNDNKKILDDNKFGIEIGEKKFRVIMPKEFTNIEKIEIMPLTKDKK